MDYQKRFDLIRSGRLVDVTSVLPRHHPAPPVAISLAVYKLLNSKSVIESKSLTELILSLVDAAWGPLDGQVLKAPIKRYFWFDQSLGVDHPLTYEFFLVKRSDREWASVISLDSDAL